MVKVAKARKSTHATKKATAKTRGKIVRDEDPNQEWDVESVGKSLFYSLTILTHRPYGTYDMIQLILQYLPLNCGNYNW